MKSVLTFLNAVLVFFIFTFAYKESLAEELPGIYCYSFGVSDNADAPLNDAKNAAILFGDFIKSKFSNPIVKVYTSGGQPATTTCVESILQTEIPNLPRYSTIIIYFAGHGVQNSTKDYDDDLHLILSGSTTTQYKTNSLRFGELVDTLDRKKMVTGIVFLDCCHSGSPLDVRSRSGKLLQNFALDNSPRFIWLFATSSKQETYSGDFTRQFLAEWGAVTAQSSCLRPDRMIDDINKKAPLLDKGYRKREMFPPKVEWCLGTIGEPCSIVTLVSKNDFRDSFHLTFSDGIEEDPNFANGDRPFFLRVASKMRTLNLSIAFGSHNPSLTLTTNDLKKDVIIVETDGKTLSRVKADARSLALNTAELLTLSKEVLAQTGVDNSEADFVRIVGRSFARNGALDDARSLYAVTAAKNPALSEFAALLTTNQEAISQHLNSLASTSEKQRYLSDLELLNGIGTAPEGWLTLSKEADPQNAAFAKARAYISYAAIGSSKISERVKIDLEKDLNFQNATQKLSEIYVIEKVGGAVVRQNASKFVETSAEWKSGKSLISEPR